MLKKGRSRPLDTAAAIQFGFASALFGLFTQAPAAPSVPECLPSTPEISISADFHDYTLDHGKSRMQLAQELSKPIPFKGFAMQGLTALGLETNYRLSVTLDKGRDGQWCALVDKVEGSFGSRVPARVMVAREIEKDTCQYRTVLDHERGHVEIGRRAAVDGARDMADKVAAALRNPIVGGTKDSAYAAAKAIVDRAVSSAADRAVATADSQNAAMDTYESYERLRQQCP